MNKENVEKWLAALESDKYRQTDSRLTVIDSDGMSHCCLGVACQVAIENGVPLEVEEMHIDGINFLQYNEENAVLPSQVMNWLGISTGMGEFQEIDGPGPDTCTEANDEARFSFKEIAVEIRKRGLV